MRVRARTAVATCFRKYADFSGRATPREFWWFYGFSFLVQLIVALPLLFLLVAMGGWVVAAYSAGIDPFLGMRWYGDLIPTMLVLAAVSLALGVALGIPLYAAQSRRLHDMGQSGWFVALNLVGLGSIPTVMALMPAQPHPNRWGDVPFDPSAEATPALA